MTADPRLERALPAILADLGAGAMPDYEADVLIEAAGIRQRPAWTFPARWLPAGPTVAAGMGPRMQTVLAAILLLILAVAVAAAYVGSHPHVPAPFGLAGNGVLVFGVEGDIVVGRAEGTTVPIVAGDGFDFGPFFSSDGTKVAFLRAVDVAGQPEADLMVVNPDGSGLRRVSAHPLNETPWSMTWAPDGRSIVVVTTARADSVLESFDAARTGDPTVIDTNGLRADGVVFQPPDGSRILFRGQHGRQLGLYLLDPRDGTLSVVVAPFESDHPQDSTTSDWSVLAPTMVADLRDPVFSPDGTVVAYQQYLPGHSSSQLFLARADGSGTPRAITSIERESFDPFVRGSLDASPVFAPDGERIAYRHFDPVTQAWRYAVVRLDNLAIVLTGPPVPDGVAALVWSPDGTQLVAIEHSGDRRVLQLDPGGDRDDGVDSWREQGWSVESDGWWMNQSLYNGFDAGTWQRVASP